MIDLSAHNASPLSRLPIELEFVRDIVQFDGPFVSEFKSSEGETFLYTWCDRNTTVNRWIVVRTPYQNLFEYLVGRISLRSVITECKDRFVYIVDLDRNASPAGYWYVPIQDLPNDYLPIEESFHPDDVIEEGFQDVYLSDAWGAEGAANLYPRRYLQTYAFHAVFGRGGDPRSVERIDYRLTRGWIFNTLYKYMRSLAPPEKRARLTAVAYASPGYARFSVDPTIAAGLRVSLLKYLGNRASIDQAVTDLARWADGRERKRGRKGRKRRTDKDGEHLTDAAANNIILEVCSQLGLKGHALIARADARRAAKVLSSYRRRLKFLAERNEKQEAMLVGLTRDET